MGDLCRSHHAVGRVLRARRVGRRSEGAGSWRGWSSAWGPWRASAGSSGAGGCEWTPRSWRRTSTTPPTARSSRMPRVVHGFGLETGCARHWLDGLSAPWFDANSLFGVCAHGCLPRQEFQSRARAAVGFCVAVRPRRPGTGRAGRGRREGLPRWPLTITDPAELRAALSWRVRALLVRAGVSAPVAALTLAVSRPTTSPPRLAAARTAPRATPVTMETTWTVRSVVAAIAVTSTSRTTCRAPTASASTPLTAPTKTPPLDCRSSPPWNTGLRAASASFPVSWFVALVRLSLGMRDASFHCPVLARHHTAATRS
jgi:hypothetical protein